MFTVVLSLYHELCIAAAGRSLWGAAVGLILGGFGLSELASRLPMGFLEIPSSPGPVAGMGNAMICLVRHPGILHRITPWTAVCDGSVQTIDPALATHGQQYGNKRYGSSVRDRMDGVTVAIAPVVRTLQRMGVLPSITVDWNRRSGRFLVTHHSLRSERLRPMVLPAVT
jgi:hypothetical protein